MRFSTRRGRLGRRPGPTTPVEAVRRYRDELMEKYESDFIPYTYQVPVSVAAAKVAEDMGWRILDRDDKAGHLEAVDRTLLLGFSDDVVVRVTATEDGSRVDVRSSSRVGISDLGKNAERIRAFLADLEARRLAAGSAARSGVSAGIRMRE